MTRGLLAELRRRRVFRVAGVYAVVAWLLIQVAATVFPLLALPGWLVRAVAVLALLGFPLAVGLAWAFDVTPDGVRRAPPVRDPGGGRRWALAGVAALVLLGGAYVGWQRFGPRAAGGVEAEGFRSVAVLPFVNLSSDPEQEYFSDGIAEELLDALAKIEGLQVPARTSSFAFKGQNTDIREIARKLDVQVVLEGSVRKAGDRVRITAQLIRADNGYHLWSESYDRELTDVFAVQDEISLAIVEALRLRLTGGAAPGLTEGRRTESREAHDLYLLGMRQIHLRRPESLRRAVEYMQKAVAADSGYVAAYAGLATAWALLPNYDSDLSTVAAARRGRAAAEQALRRDPREAMAHAALGQIAQDLEWDLAAAERHYRRAIELNPNYATAHQWLSETLQFQRRFAEAEAEARTAYRLDPLSPIILSNLAAVVWARDTDEALGYIEQALALDPSLPRLHEHRMSRLIGSGRFAEARRAIPSFVAATGSDSASLHALIDAVEDPARRATVAAQIQARFRGDFYFLSLMRERELTLAAMEMGVEERHASMPIIGTPDFDWLRGDPRFEALLRRAGVR